MRQTMSPRQSHVLEIHPESAVLIAASLYTVPGMDPGGYPSGGDDLF